MKRIILVIVLFLTSCAPQGEVLPISTDTGIYYYHDNIHLVSCWIYQGGGISCLSDNQITNVGK